nr:hypothetical protein HUO10_000628 [Paraburkholderia busanensis]
MDCKEARPLLDANADHELPAPDARRVQQHIESCEACRIESESLAVLRGALRAAPYHRAPQALRARILAGLPALEVADAPLMSRTAEGVASDVPRAVVDGGRIAAGVSGDFGGGLGASGEDAADRLSADAEPRRGTPEPDLAGAAGSEVTAQRPKRSPGWFGGWLNGWREGGGRAASGGSGGGGRGGLSGVGGLGGGRSSGRNGGFSGQRSPSGVFGGPAGMGAPARLIAPGWLATLAVALCAAAAVVTLNLHRTADVSPFTDELVESHVRAQVSGRDIDVISTDKHTVKPWFNGRLDYSPPVEDLAANGFPLEGGRLDYLAHQRVAVLVYHYRKHVIDVYVFPQAAAGTARDTTGGQSGEGGLPGALQGALSSTARTTFEREGYSIAQWNAAGMTWWAITDAAPDALTGLETALKARLAAGAERTEGS